MRAPAPYRLLLRLLPAAFRASHGPAMEEAFLGLRRTATGFIAVLGLYLSEARDLARTALRLRFGRDRFRAPGNAERARSGASSLARLRDDVVFAARALVRQPAFALFTVGTLALGIGATTAIFSAIETVVLRPLPFRDSDRLVSLWRKFAGGRSLIQPTGEQFRVWSAETEVFDGVEPFTWESLTVTGEGEPTSLRALLMRPSLPAFLGMPPIRGRTLLPEEVAGAGAHVVLVSHGLWKDRFGADPEIVGRTIRIEGAPWTVVGVMPPSATRPDGSPGTIDLWVPLPEDRGDRGASIVTRLRDGVSLETAQKRLDFLASQAASAGGEPEGGGSAQLAADFGRDGLAGTLRVLMVAVTLLLLIACVNVSNLLLHRAAARRQETAVRAALGAGRGRLVRQHLLESTLLALCGGVGGVALAWGAIRALGGVRPTRLAALESVAVDGRVLLFSFAVSLVAGLLFGILPALRATAGDALAGLGRGPRQTGADVVPRRFRWSLVAGEVALSFALLVGSALFIASLHELRANDPGFEVDGLIDAAITLPSWSYPDAVARKGVYEAMRDRVAGIAGVELVVEAEGVPPGMGIIFGRVQVDGGVRDDESTVFRGGFVGPGFLGALGQPLLAGRDFEPGDGDRKPLPVVIGESTASRFFPEGSAIGRQFDLSDDGDFGMVVIGIARDIRIDGLAHSAANPLLYAPMQEHHGQIHLLVRASATGPAMISAIRAAVLAVESEAVVGSVATMTDMMADSLARERFATTMMSVFAALALLLAAVGLYGVLSQVVTQRTAEIGIRMSLGADARRIRALVLGSALAATAAGLLVGGAIGAAGIRALSSQLFGLDRSSPAAWVAAAGVMTLVAVAATWLPARRAAAIDPVRAMRMD